MKGKKETENEIDEIRLMVTEGEEQISTKEKNERE